MSNALRKAINKVNICIGVLAKPLARKNTEILQLNIGLFCNQACSHCHVESSPKRKEMMSRETAEKCLDIIRATESIHTVDITGKLT